MRFTLPFSQIIDIDGIDDTFTADVRITPAGCDIIPKSDDSGTLECELVLLVNCVAKKAFHLRDRHRCIFHLL